MKTRIKLLLLAILLSLFRAIGRLLPIRRNKWIIGGDRRAAMEGNSLYFYEHVIRHHPHIRLIWISRARNCVQDARQRGGESYHNFSLRGLFHVLTARVYLFSIDPSDVIFVNARRSLVVNLWHGMPLKKIAYDAVDSSIQSVKPESMLQRLSGVLQWSDVSFHIATSALYQSVLRSAFRSSSVEITGQPRDDLFCRPKRDEMAATIRRRMGWSDRRVVTYLPTHRKHGAGQRPAILLQSRTGEVRTRLGAETLIVTKNHTLMGTAARGEGAEGGATVEIDRHAIETQQLLLATDILVTDYSSVFVDFLCLDRPIIFYWFDHYAVEESELYFNDPELLPGCVVSDEEALLAALAGIIGGNDPGQAKRLRLRQRYQEHSDGRNSERILEAIGHRIGMRESR